MGKSRKSRDKEVLHAQLLEEYSSSIDTSTILSILSDFDLSEPTQLKSAQQILEILKNDAPLEEASGFDSSGAGGSGSLVEGPETARNDESRSGSLHDWKTTTDDTSLGQGMSVSDLEGIDSGKSSMPSTRDESPDKTWTGLKNDKRTLEEKEASLISIFPILKPFDVKHSLKQHNGDAMLALDDLMTQSFLEDNGIRHKSIDAFYESATPLKQRKGKKKGRRAPAWDLYCLDADLPIESKWDKAKEDIEFIALNANMPEKQVASLYHSSGGSVRETVVAIIKPLRIAYENAPEDLLLLAQAFELHEQFPSVSQQDLQILVRVTNPSRAAASALAKCLALPTSAINKCPIHIEFRHTPIHLSSTEPSSISPAFKAPLSYANAAESSAAAAGHIGARNQNYGKAAHYYKKGKSDHLMGGAAAYYAEEARTHNVLAKQASSAAAEQHVASQSSRTQLDLHGVNVKDAVRIAKERVTTWWHELKDNESGINRGGGVSYRIVTGLGLHSKGGRAKLGPAVGNMLLREGWKVEVGHGVLIVKGVAKMK